MASQLRRGSESRSVEAEMKGKVGDVVGKDVGSRGQKGGTVHSVDDPSGGRTDSLSGEYCSLDAGSIGGMIEARSLSCQRFLMREWGPGK